MSTILTPLFCTDNSLQCGCWECSHLLQIIESLRGRFKFRCLFMLDIYTTYLLQPYSLQRMKRERTPIRLKWHTQFESDYIPFPILKCSNYEQTVKETRKRKRQLATLLVQLH